ncbi:THAP domain-containing protein 10 [Holothuria leucospilota]|uniref:THAP domain-containing protein 10 n=1 Tax=Holothuria leucospilota TaxID=206669 RepID=A0A9Q1C4I9_HOLLE|nr:THAP domain-containing protein 10 [Holothuria leucospilota]
MARGNIKCAVGGCGNESRYGITVYKFPKDRKQEMNWVRFVKKTQPNFVVMKNSGICSEHFSEDCYDQAFKMKQEFGLLPASRIRRGPPLLPNAMPTVIRRSLTSSPSNSSKDFFLSAEAQQLGPSGKKPRLASEKRAKKKYINELLQEPVIKPEPVKKKAQVQKEVLQQRKESEDTVISEEFTTILWVPNFGEVVLPGPDENVGGFSSAGQPVTTPSSSALPLQRAATPNTSVVSFQPAATPNSSAISCQPAATPNSSTLPSQLVTTPRSSIIPSDPSLDNSSASQRNCTDISSRLRPIPKYVQISSATKKDAWTQYEDEENVISSEPISANESDTILADESDTTELDIQVIGEPGVVNLDHGYATKEQRSDPGGCEVIHAGTGSGSSKSHGGSSNSSNRKNSYYAASQKVVDERKFIVTESALDELLSALRCPKCSSPPKVTDKSDPVGTLLKISAWCENGHQILDWKSQPVVGEMPLLDILCCAALLFAANTYNQICNFMGFLNVNFVDKKQFNSLQHKHLCSLINGMWMKEKNRHYADLQNDSQVVLCGDSSLDIPGFCTYTLLDENSGKVVNFESKQVNDQKCSLNSVEKLGFSECLDQVLKKGIRVKAVATDQHAGIAEVVRERYKNHNVKHDFHMHHLSKQLAKKVSERAKLTDNGELAFLGASLQNHLYWAASTCGGDPKVLQEKWTSLIDLVPQVKIQETDGKVVACAPVLPEGKNVWIRISSESCEELSSIVYDPQFLYDVGLLKEFYHSDGIVKFQSVMRKYCPEGEKLTHQGLQARIKLAALEHNANTESAIQKKLRKVKGKLQIASNGEVIIYPKEKRKWMENSVFAGRCYSYVYDMLIEVIWRTLQQPRPSQVFRSVAGSQEVVREGKEMRKLPSEDVTIHLQLDSSDSPPPPPPPTQPSHPLGQ